MSDFDNTNRGQIWRNEKKDKDTHPDFTGSLNVNGVEYWVSAWKRKEGANPKAPALSFTVKPKEEQQQSISQRATPKAPNSYAAATGRRDPISTGLSDDDMDGDRIPF
jgi:hypothetical protein